MFITQINTHEKDRYRLHQAVFEPFSGRVSLSGRDFCFRRNTVGAVIYSAVAFDESSVELTIKQSAEYNFSVLCCAGRGTYRDESGKRHRKSAYKNEQDVLDWLSRWLEHCAEIISAIGERMPHESVIKPCGTRMVWPVWNLSGSMIVNDAEAFERAICGGIGQGCAFGLGLVTISERVNGSA